jgi:hypothetical protein
MKREAGRQAGEEVETHSKLTNLICTLIFSNLQCNEIEAK